MVPGLRIPAFAGMTKKLDYRVKCLATLDRKTRCLNNSPKFFSVFEDL
ncbi:Uncharacterized protein dnm_007890 [Desulfonema magnum]|uniref:Uncharacterized protein n=1 Tax=Desulfonema magnum TaxID=45655 RepID=A0A975BGJ2_9BACT|nr:Uncharacterized protein dnm_007890 [Desulfonema magnum]